MWIATRYGFFAIACEQYTDGSLEPDVLQIRSHSPDHLQALKEQYDLPNPIVADNAHHEPYKLVLSKATVAQIVSQITTGIDYHALGTTVKRERPKDYGLQRFLQETWLLAKRWLPYTKPRSQQAEQATSGINNGNSKPINKDPA